MCDLGASGANPYGDLVGVAGDHRGDGELFAVGGELDVDGGDERAVFHLLHVGLALIHPMDLDLIEAEVAGRGRNMAVGFPGEVEVPCLPT